MHNTAAESVKSEDGLPGGPGYPYAGLRGHDLVLWALQAGPDCLPGLGAGQVRNFEMVSMRQGIAWPEGFFESSIQELMPHRYHA